MFTNLPHCRRLMGEEGNVERDVIGEVAGAADVEAHHREAGQCEVSEESEEGLASTTAVAVSLHQFISHEICSVRFGTSSHPSSSINLVE